jgi:hypothetical protein
MPFGEAVTTIAAIAALALTFLAIIRLIGATVMHRTIRRVVDKDPASAEPMLSRLMAPPRQSGDDRVAIILVAIGVAMIGASLIAVDDPGIVRAATGAALFPLLIGGALWLRSYLLERARRREPGE